MTRSVVPGLVLGAAGIVILAAVVGGIWVMGPPAEQRLRSLDAKRLQDLGSIVSAVSVYQAHHKRLPASLDELSKDDDIGFASKDPATGAAYEYEASEGNVFLVCATFARASEEDGGRPASSYRRPAQWTHGVGRQCFYRYAS